VTATRVCKVCEQQLPESRFSVNQGYRANTCKSCRTDQNNAIRNSSASDFLRQALVSLKSSRSKQGFEFTLTHDDLLGIYEAQGGICALSGVLMTRHRDGSGERPTNCSIDRINPTRGYTRRNIQLVCWQVNKMKHGLMEPEFWWWIQNICRHSEEPKL